MSDGIITEVAELIALKQYSHNSGIGSNSTHGIHGSRFLSKLRGRGMEFAEVRNYQAGHEIRHMEWRITARTGRPHIKVYHEERDRPVVIMNDFNPSMYFGTKIAFKSVIAARVAALIAWAAVRQGDKVGGLLAAFDKHNEFMPKAREHAILPWLAKLSSYTKAIPSAGQRNYRQLSDTLQRLRRVTHPGSILILISDFYALDAASEQYLSRLRAHNDMIVYHICDPTELAPPVPGCYAITNGAQSMVLDVRQSVVHDAYLQFCNEHQQTTRLLCKKLQIPYIQVTGNHDLPKLVYQTFLRRMHA